MNLRKIFNFLAKHYQEIIAAGTSVISFADFAAMMLQKLLAKTPNGVPDEVTDEMMQELLDDFAGPLPDPDSIFGPLEPGTPEPHN